MKISFEAMRVVRAALETYRETVEATGLTASTKQTYLLHAEHFVRWLADDFEPGAGHGRRRASSLVR